MLWVLFLIILLTVRVLFAKSSSNLINLIVASILLFWVPIYSDWSKSPFSQLFKTMIIVCFWLFRVRTAYSFLCIFCSISWIPCFIIFTSLFKLSTLSLIFLSNPRVVYVYPLSLLYLSNINTSLIFLILSKNMS